MKKENILKILLFVFIFVLALCLRIVYLDTPLWYDEACSWAIAKQSFPMGIMDYLLHTDLQHTPLYFFILHIFMKIFGDGEFALKIPSLIFGFLSVPLSYIVAKKITGKIEAMFITAIVALSPVMIIFSAEVRMYSMVAFLILLSLNYLIDFEQKNDKKSLIKLVVTNIFIPYTLVGGILYNIPLFVIYAFYLAKNNTEKLIKYLKFSVIEWVALIPYFCLIGYYAAQRRLFVVSHEDILRFSAIVDVVKNFFGVVPDANIYWPTNGLYNLTFLFVLLTIIPCCYFVYGLIKGLKKSDNFEKVIYSIFLVSFALSLVVASLKFSILTVRYVLYLFVPFVILSVIGLFKSLSEKHCKCFLSLFLIGILISSIKYFPDNKIAKRMAFQDVRIEADKLGLNSYDMVIMPFGSDAPYYFKNLTSPRVFDFDFHKQVRNPYNEKYYDKSMQKSMIGDKKYSTLYNAIYSKDFVSDSYYYYFIANVNNTIPSGRYVLLAFYAEDADSVVSMDELKNIVTDIKYLKNNFLGVFLKKYIVETLGMISLDFDLEQAYQKGNYSYLLYKKR